MHAQNRGYATCMLTKVLTSARVRAWHMQGASLATICLCITLWIRAKTVDQDERGNAERRALFVGLWPPMFWLIGDSLVLEEQLAASALKRRRRRAPCRRRARGSSGG
jgi:hypothetical protein